jgi:hypothetical protein
VYSVKPYDVLKEECLCKNGYCVMEDTICSLVLLNVFKLILFIFISVK